MKIKWYACGWQEGWNQSFHDNGKNLFPIRVMEVDNEGTYAEGFDHGYETGIRFQSSENTELLGAQIDRTH